MEKYSRAQQREEARDMLDDGDLELSDRLFEESFEFSEAQFNDWKIRFHNIASLNDLRELLSSPIAQERVGSVNQFLRDELESYFDVYEDLPLGEVDDLKQAVDLSKKEFIIWSLESGWLRYHRAQKDNQKDKESCAMLIQTLIHKSEKLVFPDKKANFAYLENDEAWTYRERIYDAGWSAVEINRLLEHYAELEMPDTFDFLLDFIAQNPSGYYTETLANIFSKKDPNVAAEQLLDRLKREKNEYVKNAYSRILYHLECGKIRVQKGQVEYLLKKYNLEGEKKFEAVNAIRITRDGKLGFLDDQNRLIGYIAFGNFESDQEKEVQIMEVATEMLLFTKPQSEGEQKKFEQEKKEFLENYYKIFFEGFIEQKTSVQINNLTLKEQFWFYKFLKSLEDTENYDRMIRTAQKFGENFIRCFIAFELDANAGEKLFFIAKYYDENEAKVIFEAYAHLGMSADDMDKELGEFFVQAPESLDKHQATSEIMKRAGELLTDFSQKKAESISVPNFVNSVQGIRADLIVFAALSKMTFKGKGETGFHNIRDLSFGRVSGIDIPKDIQQQMIDVARENYKSTPDIAEDFAALFEQSELLEKNDFVILTRKNKETGIDELISFLRIEKRSDGKVHVAAFHVKGALRSSGLGEQMQINTLRMLAQTDTIHAEVITENIVGTQYVEKLGFVGKKFAYNSAEEKTYLGEFEIEMGKDTLTYALRNPKLDLLTMYEKNFSQTDPADHIGEAVILARFDLSTQMNEMASLADRLINEEGYHLVRYVSLSKDGTKRLYGFEKVPATV